MTADLLFCEISSQQVSGIGSIHQDWVQERCKGREMMFKKVQPVPVHHHSCLQKRWYGQCPSISVISMATDAASAPSPQHPHHHLSPQLSLLPVDHGFTHSHLLYLPLILLNSLNLLLLSKLSVSLSMAHTNTYDLSSHWSSSLSVAFQNPRNLLWT